MKAVRLELLRQDHFKRFSDLVTQRYRLFYGDVDVSMSSHILACHVSLSDPFGYMTLRKEVYSITFKSDLVGFTTLTWKRGGSVKTGPTILFEQFRGRGLGPLTQLALQGRALAAGARKIYGTVSSANVMAAAYMKKAGYSIEARLKAHYSPLHDEIIFGRVLRSDGGGENRTAIELEEKVDGHLYMLSAQEVTAAEAELRSLIHRDLVDADGELIGNIAKTTKFAWDKFASKPKRISVIKAGGAIVGALAMIPKRGGVIKINRFGRVPVSQFEQHLGEHRKTWTELGFRKLTLFIPQFMVGFHSRLLSENWISEGTLRSPYRVGIDINILSSFLTNEA